MLGKSKKAFVETQFNWIFIIIAGGVILLFFFSIVNKQKDVSEFKVTGTIKSDLRVILTGAKVSTGTASLIDMPNIGINYDCQGFSVGNLNPIRLKNAFSPSLIQGYGLMAWALDWNVPFRAANFLYLTSNQIRYIIVDDDISNPNSFAEELNKTLPPREIVQDEKTKILIDKEFIETSDLINIQDKNNYKVRFVFFSYPSGGEGLSYLGDMKDKDVTAVYIHDHTGIDGYGTLTFFQKSGTSWVEFTPDPLITSTTYYIGEASLIGAVFTDDIETYNCNMKRAFESLSIVSSIYTNRTKTLQDFYIQNGGVLCATQFGVALTPLEGIGLQSASLSLGFPAVVEGLNQYASTLVNANEYIQKLSCEEIY